MRLLIQPSRRDKNQCLGMRAISARVQSNRAQCKRQTAWRIAVIRSDIERQFLLLQVEVDVMERRGAETPPCTLQYRRNPLNASVSCTISTG